MNTIRLIAVFALLSVGMLAADAAESPLMVASSPAVIATVQGAGGIQLSSTDAGDYTLDSVASLAAKPGDCFAIKLRAKVGVDMAARPELVCYDAQGRVVSGATAFGRGERVSTTNWQTFDRVFMAPLNTTMVRARVLASGRGTISLEGLELRTTQVDAYKTGALITQPSPRSRTGVVLESNFGIVNAEQISRVDRDGDGKWALITVDLDRMTAPEKKGEDWRSNFEDNPNVILWSDGAVLKSDTIARDRAPDAARALHYRFQARPGPYNVYVNDPGRAVAVSLDGRTWGRAAAGQEIDLGVMPARDGVIEFWVDACYADPVKAGPAYFDYVRLMPTKDAASIDRLLAAGRQRPPQITRGAAEDTKVAIMVEAPPFRGARIWPVRCGLPIPAGELVSAQNVAVLDAAGKKRPSQNRVTATWPDGSVRWLFLDFMHDPSKATENFTVTYGNPVKALAPSSGIKVVRNDSGVQVDTGAIKFLVSGKRFGFLENMTLANGQSVQREPIRSEIIEADGRVWAANELPVANLAIEQEGPLHTVILVETKLAESGKPSEGFYHRARIHAYAGSPLVEVDYFVVNTDSRPAKDVGGSMASQVMVKSFSLGIRPEVAIAKARHDAGAAGATGARVQKSAELTLAVDGGTKREVAGTAQGWLGLELANGTNFHVGLAEFREQFPKALRWTPQQVNIDLWAEEGGAFKWIEGVGKTHHFALLYGSGGVDDGLLLSAGPVLAAAQPEWYVKSRALGDIVSSAGSGEPAIERGLNAYMTDVVIGKVGLGFENYGDHSSSGYVKGSPLWDNNEYDLPAACMVHFARTGDRAALRLGLASAQHYLDVDTIHYSSQHAAWARAQHVHSHGLFGHHTAAGPDYNHAGFVQGLIWHSYLTGDPMGLEGARGIADWATRSLPILSGGMERLIGHALMTCNDVYEATGEEKYLRGSAALVDQALKWEHPIRSGFLSTIYETPAYYSGSAFCNGVISAGILKFNCWAHLPEVETMLERFARWTLTDMWVMPEGIASKGGSPRRGGSPQHIGNQGRLMAHVYAQTKDPFFLVPPLKLAEAGYGPNARAIFGTRSVGLVYNYLPWLLASAQENGSPRPDERFEISLQEQPRKLPPGAKAIYVFQLTNKGTEPIEDLRASFHSRIDFATVAVEPPPARLAPGQSVTCRYELQAPAQINLSCEYNNVAYAHWSMLYRRGPQAQFAHRVVKIEVVPGPESLAPASNSRP